MKVGSSIFRLGKKEGGNAERYKNKWVLAFHWKSETGRRKQKTYSFRTEQDAKDARPRLEAELRKTEGRNTVGDRMTFADLAREAKRTFYGPAKIVNGRKIAGIKSHRQAWILIDVLTEYFGDKRLSRMTRNDMEGFKSWRYDQGDRRGYQGRLEPKDRKPVSASAVNRALAIFSRMMKHAHAEGWVARDVTLGSKAIDRDAEKAKTRTLTAEEESRLLAVCGGERVITYSRSGKTVKAKVTAENPYLKAIILLGLDAGLRRNEILTLDWEDIDLERKTVELKSQHTKTQFSRKIPLINRSVAELRALPSYASTGPVFPFNDFKRSWSTAVKLAGIERLTFHDLRRSFISRLCASGVSLAVVGKLAGHKTLQTTQKHYVSIEDPAILEEVRVKMNAAAATTSPVIFDESLAEN